MKKYYGINNETIVDMIMKRVKRAIYVFAEEKEDKEKSETLEDKKEDKKEEKEIPNFNYEDLISKARKEEKDKLYPKIENLEQEKKDLIEKHNNALLKMAELEDKLTKTGEQSKDKTVSENDEIANLKKALEEKENELKGILETTEDIKDVEDRVRQAVVDEYEVKLYREQKLREVGDNIISELVVGETKEDIDKSLAHSQKRFNEIVQNTMSGIKVPAVNTSVSKLNSKDFNIEDLAQLDPRSDEYKELRAKLGLK